MADKQIIADNERQYHQRPPQQSQQPPLMGYPGFKFDPSDHELIKNFLEKKINGIELRFNPIYEVNIYQYHPRDLTERCKPQGKNDVWYFFTPREKKYKFGVRPARNTGDNGFWKAMRDKKIRDDVDENKVIGFRKTLNYFEGKQSGVDKSRTTTEWKMHEYQTLDQAESSKAKIEQLKRTRHAPTSMSLDVVLCKIFCKKEVARKQPAVLVTEKKAATRVNSSGKGKGKVKADDNINNPPNNQIELPVASEMNNSNHVSKYNTGATTTTTTTDYNGKARSFGCYNNLGGINFNNPTAVYSGGVDYFQGMQQFPVPYDQPYPPIIMRQQQPFQFHDPSTSTSSSLSSYPKVSSPLMNSEYPYDANYNNGPGTQQRCFSDHDMVSFNNGVVPSQQLLPMPGSTNLFASSSPTPDRMMTATHGSATEQAAKEEENNESSDEDIYDVILNELMM